MIVVSAYISKEVSVLEISADLFLYITHRLAYINSQSWDKDTIEKKLDEEVKRFGSFTVNIVDELLMPIKETDNIGHLYVDTDKKVH